MWIISIVTINTTTYEYDLLNRLIEVVDGSNKEVITYSGNNISKKEYYQNSILIKAINYEYDSTWSERLVKIVDGSNITDINYTGTNYLANPSNYGDKSLTWEGPNLTEIDNNIIYTYNEDNIRIRKQVGSVVTNYNISGNKILSERTNANTTHYHYDESGNIVGYTYNNTPYFYLRDITGVISRVLDETGETVVLYKYDSWGNLIDEIINDPVGASANKFIYKGYYYDRESNFYYLNSRYYDPYASRFISADNINYLDTDSISGLGLFIYCNNNPVMYFDPNGNFAISTFLIMFAVSALATWAAGELFGHQLVGGIGSTANGVGAISTGISLMAFGPLGWIIGGIAIIAGVATVAFGSAEIQQHFSGNNWIQDATGWNNEIYNGLYIGANILSSVATIGGNMYKKHMTTTGTSSTPNTAKKYTRYVQNTSDGSPMRVTQYNRLGKQSWRIDYTGRTHAGIPTPHKIMYAYNKLGQPLKNMIRIIGWTKKIHWWYI